MITKFSQTILSIRTRDIIFPIDSVGFVNTLAKSGYQITARPPPPAQPGTRMEVSGEVARNAGVAVDLEGDKEQISVRGNNSSIVVTTFLDVMSAVKDNMSIKLEERASFFEVNVIYHVETDKSPIETISKTESNVHKSLGNIFGVEHASPLSIHLFTKGSKVNSANWFDISIKPLLPILSETVYEIIVVLRREKLSHILTFLDGVEQKMIEALTFLEKNIE